MLVGLEACAATGVNFVGRRSKRVAERAGAETRRPEASDEFAARVKDSFQLKGPDTSKRLTIKIPAQGSSKNVVDEDDVEVPPPIDLAREVSGIDVLAAVRGKYADDVFFKPIVDKPAEFKNFQYNDTERLLYLLQDDERLLCIPNAKIDDRAVREVVIAEAHRLLAHLGFRKTYDYLRSFVWWKTLLPDVRAFCDSCMVCKRSKASTLKPYGLLNPLEIQSQPWDAIGIDFVGPLPESKNRDGSFNAITTIIDLFSGMVHLVPSRTDYTAKRVAELVFAEVYKLHGLPRYIVSDRDPLFTSHFWEELHKLIGTRLRMSSAFHPQSDGATERANKTLGQMLRVCVSADQKNWVSRLPAIEFAINSSRSESTGYAPFFLNTGRVPRSFIWDKDQPVDFPGVRVFAKRIQAAIMHAHDCLIAARVKSVRNANRKRTKAPFKNADLVYIDTHNISLPKGTSRKLAPKFIGPYPITEDFGNFSFRVKLPSTLTRRGVHDVFHASLLRVHEPNDDKLFPGRLDTQVFDLEDLEGGWMAEKILSHKSVNGNLEFNILGGNGDTKWVKYDDCKDLLVVGQYLEAKGMDQPETSDVSAAGIEIDTDINLETSFIFPFYSMSLSPPPTFSTLPQSPSTPTSDLTDISDASPIPDDTSLAPASPNYTPEPSDTPADTPSVLSTLRFSKVRQPTTTTPDITMADAMDPADAPAPEATVDPTNEQNVYTLTAHLPTFGTVGLFENLFFGQHKTFYFRDENQHLLEFPPGWLKKCLQYASELNRMRQTDRNISWAEPIGYRQLAEYLNADPGANGARLPTVDPDGTITLGTGSFPLFVNHPSDEEMEEINAPCVLLGDIDIGSLIRKVVQGSGNDTPRSGGSRGSSRPGSPFVRSKSRNFKPY